MNALDIGHSVKYSSLLCSACTGEKKIWRNEFKTLFFCIYFEISLVNSQISYSYHKVSIHSYMQVLCRHLFFLKYNKTINII